MGLPPLGFPDYSDLFPYSVDDWYEGLDQANTFADVVDYLDWAVPQLLDSLEWLEELWKKYLDENHLEYFEEAME